MFSCQYIARPRKKHHETWELYKKRREKGEGDLYPPYGRPHSFTPSMQITPQIVSVVLDATRADAPPTRAAASIVRLIAIVR